MGHLVSRVRGESGEASPNLLLQGSPHHYSAAGPDIFMNRHHNITFKNETALGHPSARRKEGDTRRAWDPSVLPAGVSDSRLGLPGCSLCSQQVPQFFVSGTFCPGGRLLRAVLGGGGPRSLRLTRGFPGAAQPPYERQLTLCCAQDPAAARARVLDPPRNNTKQELLAWA